jgi:hypothetical protein
MEKINLAENPKFKFIYEDKFKNKWYTYVNPADIDAVRGIRAIRAERYISMKVSEKELELALEAQRKAAKDGDWLQVGAITFDLLTRIKMITEENSLLDLASIYCLLEDENPSMCMDSVFEKKQKIYHEDLETRSFFLRIAISLSKSLENMPESDILTFLEQTRPIAERLNRHIENPNERYSSSIHS